MQDLSGLTRNIKDDAADSKGMHPRYGEHQMLLSVW